MITIVPFGCHILTFIKVNLAYTGCFGHGAVRTQVICQSRRNSNKRDNQDSKINKRDSVFYLLRLWQDSNHNGISEPSELRALPDLGLKTLELAYKRSKRIDPYGNEFRFRAKVKDLNDAQLGRWAWDVFLRSEN